MSESPSRINWLILRGLLVDGKPDAPTQNFHEGLRVYPLSQADAPPAMEFISLSEKEFNTIHANDVSFFDELDAVIQREPLGVIDPEIRGLLASIGISKGTPFAPDERMRALLTEAVAVANGTARAIAFKTRDPEAYLYPDRRWKTAFIGNDYRWLRDDGVGGRNLDARTLFFYIATVNTPAMALQHPRRRIPVRLHRARQPRRVPRRRQPLPAHHPARRPGQGLLVGRRLRPPDPIRAPDRPGVPEQEQHPRPAGHERRRLDHPHLRADRTRRPARQLDPDRPRQEMVHHPAALRPARAVVRQDLGPRRHRTARRRLAAFHAIGMTTADAPPSTLAFWSTTPDGSENGDA